MTPIVSIITPAYNSAGFIEDTIASVLAQTFGDFELLIADDCSTDNTFGVLLRTQARDARVRPLRCAANGGPAAARNVALEAARGRYIAFLDSDDAWAPQKLERQLAFMQRTNAAISFTAYHRVNEQGKALTGTARVPARLDYRAVLRNSAIPTSSAMIDASQTGPFRMKQCYYDDYALWLDLLGRGHEALGMPDDLMIYRVRSGSWSRDKLHSSVQMWKTYRQIEKLNLPTAAWCFAGYLTNAFGKAFHQYVIAR